VEATDSMVRVAAIHYEQTIFTVMLKEVEKTTFDYVFLLLMIQLLYAHAFFECPDIVYS
jgi:hypothetical protein